MKIATWLFPDSTAEALTYTLLHSLWQGLVILLLLKIALLVIPQQRSNYRYSAAAASLALILISSITTFFLLYESAEVQPPTAGIVLLTENGSAMVKQSVSDQVFSIVGSYKDYILIAWSLGCGFFLLRLSGGYWYLHQLRRTSLVLQNELASRVAELSRRLNLKTSVILAESARVHAPLVIGVIRPFIILPTALASGLSTEQLEAILLHELMHIKRNDFVLNLLQSVLEALLFFNPFIWMISSILRTEREHCCDDAVIINGANTREYVKALAAMEETKVNNTLALSLIGNKNQLLERIKRLMEKSVKNYSLREKAVPVVFLLVGLMCASWFSIQKGSVPITAMTDDKIVATDTSIRKKQKTASYSREKTTSVRRDGKSEEKIVEHYDGDEDLKPMLDEMASMEFTIPPMPEFDFPPMPDFPDVSAFAGVPPFPDMIFSLDTIPPHRVGAHDWSEFEREFTEKFQEKFEDFYMENRREFESMMEEFQEKFAEDGNAIERLQELSAIRHESMEHHALAMAEHEKNMRKQEEHMEKFQEQMRHWEKENHERMKKVEENLKTLEENMKKFSKELKAELVRDGYLKESDEVRQMHWDENGDIEINDIKIKDSDLKKYRELHKKHFNDSQGDFHFSE